MHQRRPHQVRSIPAFAGPACINLGVLWQEFTSVCVFNRQRTTGSHRLPASVHASAAITVAVTSTMHARRVCSARGEQGKSTRLSSSTSSSNRQVLRQAAVKRQRTMQPPGAAMGPSIVTVVQCCHMIVCHGLLCISDNLMRLCTHRCWWISVRAAQARVQRSRKLSTIQVFCSTCIRVFEETYHSGT